MQYGKNNTERKTKQNNTQPLSEASTVSLYHSEERESLTLKREKPDKNF